MNDNSKTVILSVWIDGEWVAREFRVTCHRYDKKGRLWLICADAEGRVRMARFGEYGFGSGIHGGALGGRDHRCGGHVRREDRVE